ncbi:MAG: family 10 glycosylhydrolase [Clostridia bacterium]
MKTKAVYIILWILLIATVLIVGNNSYQNEEIDEEIVQESEEITITENEEDEYMQGLWVSYIDLTTSEKTMEAFEANFTQIVQSAKEVGTTALFVHVRPFSDALYESDYYPWSHILTGTQGQDPGYDPLEFMIELCHSQGIEFHAWINPMRVALETIPSELSVDSVYNTWIDEHPYYFIETDSGIYLNPAYTEVRELIANGVAEIVENYDVDGIHFDDYFYPEDISEEDSLAYEAYVEITENPLGLSDWRKANVNVMVSLVYRTIKNIDETVSFGISPQASLSNNEELCADVMLWCSVSGYLDYICPQIYFSYENEALAFLESLETWTNLQKHENLEIYIGLALYKAGTDSDGGTWLERDDIIVSQIADSINYGCDGYILYDSSSLTSELAKSEVENIISSEYS